MLCTEKKKNKTTVEHNNMQCTYRATVYIYSYTRMFRIDLFLCQNYAGTHAAIMGSR